MRKIAFLILALVCAAGMRAATTVRIDSLYYSLGTTTATVIQDQTSGQAMYKAYTTVTIPASVTYNNYTYPVISIGTSAFESCSNLQAVTLPSSITSIGQDAFYYCSKLGSINLPEGLTTIGLRAFVHCNLTSVTIPSTVSSIGNYAFKDCPLTTVVWNPVNCSISTGEYAP
ncbi:MAG: leucine-rich repeat domain-containing protein, partial [Paludibacteraceae bacterium]|nr:leucine-rich repeat domain-containing protein [Paludibacteraceae bacterium]